MSRTVTPDAPVASHSRSIEEALDSGFLPSDPTYRKTGSFADEKPARKSDDEEQAEYERELNGQAHDEENEQDEQQEDRQNEDQEHSASSGEQDGETAAASQTADTQNGKTNQDRNQRTRRQSEGRWRKLSRENRELRERLARLESGRTETSTSTAQNRDTQQAATAAADAKSNAAPRPKIDDVDEKTGQPKYKTFPDYEAAKDQWLQDEAIRKFQETQSKTEKERAHQQAQETISREWGNRCKTAEKDFPDFKEVALNPDLPIKQGSVVDVFILSRPQGAKVLYHLGQNPDLLDEINAMSPIDAAYALSEIEIKVSGRSSSSSARTVTQASRPPHQLSGKGTVSKDAVVDAVEHQDQGTYQREQNARDPRLLAVRNSRRK